MSFKSFIDSFAHGLGFGMLYGNPYLSCCSNPFMYNPYMCGSISLFAYPSINTMNFFPQTPVFSQPEFNFSFDTDSVNNQMQQMNFEFPKFDFNSVFNSTQFNNNSICANTFFNSTLGDSYVQSHKTENVKEEKDYNAQQRTDSNDTKPTKYNDIIAKYAKQYGVEEALIKAVIKQESCYNPKAVSRCGAKGLMQLMPATAKKYGVDNVFDPEQNIKGGVAFLKSLLDRFNGNTRIAVAAYNAGPNRSCYSRGEIPDNPETQKYVKNVLAYYEDYKRIS